MPNPPNNNDLQRERVRFLNQSLSLQSIIKQGSIANSSRDNVLPVVTPSLPSVSPSVTSTITNTPTPSITITPSLTPTITLTQTPTITPTISLSPTVTQTTTQTLTITPTISLTTTITPTISITPTITPTVTQTPVQLLQLYKDQDILLLGLKDNAFDVPPQFNKLNDFNLKQLNGLYRVETLNEILVGNNYSETIIKRYNIEGQQLSFLQSLSGQGLDNTWRLIFEIDNEGNTGTLFIGPSSYGSTLSLPVSNYSYDDLTFFSDQFSIQDAYVTDKFTNPTIASSAIMIRGMSSLDFNFNTLSGSFNGMVLNRVPGLFNNAPSFSGINFFGIASLSLEFDFARNPTSFWLLAMANNEGNISLALSSSNAANNLPFSGFKIDPFFTYTEFVSTNVSGVRLISVNKDDFYIPIPTPSITPTISITPTTTPTISITPTTTPTITLTPSMTPSITPTISITPTVHLPDSVPVWSTNSVEVYDPNLFWDGIYYKDGQGIGGWQPGGGDNGLFPPNFGSMHNPYDRWAFFNSDSYTYVLHPNANDSNFIPKTGWPGGITLSAYS